MNVKELYTNASKIRDEYLDSFQTTLADRCNDVFTQMINLAFRNDLHRDELPEVFPIYDVTFSRDSIEALMKRLGLSVKVQLTYNTYAKGNSFQITQIKNGDKLLS